MNPYIIVQARSGGVRFPGKVLSHIHGKIMLERVLERCALARVAGVAVALHAEDSTLIDLCQRRGWQHYAGEAECDVLRRYVNAAYVFTADPVVRVTADCPLIDYRVINQLLDLQAETGADYACNNLHLPARDWPHGLDCEVITRRALMQANEEATSADDREHVTEYIRNSGKFKCVHLPGTGGAFSNLRLTVDTPDDIEMIRQLWGLFSQ